jgi:hypothetical protein
MTTATATPSVALEPSGANVGPFATTFVYAAPSELAVEIIDADGVVTELVLGTDFTEAALSGNRLLYGGEITLELASIPGGDWGSGDTQQRLTMERLTVAEQTTDFPNAEGFQPEDTGDAVDKLTRIVQELRAGLERSLQVNIGDELPTLAELIETITNQIVAALEGEDLDAVVVAAVLANLATIIAAAAAELQDLIDAMEAAALALVPIVYATDGGAANAIELTLDPAPVEADLARGLHHHRQDGGAEHRGDDDRGQRLSGPSTSSMRRARRWRPAR